MQFFRVLYRYIAKHYESNWWIKSLKKPPRNQLLPNHEQSCQFVPARK